MFEYQNERLLDPFIRSPCTIDLFRNTEVSRFDLLQHFFENFQNRRIDLPRISALYLFLEMHDSSCGC